MIKTNVVKGQRKVFAKLMGCEYDAYNILRKRLPSYIHIDKEMLKIKPIYKASATCHPEDDFNAEVGIDLAKARVIEKYNRDVTRVLTKIAEDLDIYIEYVDIKLDHLVG